MNPMIRLQDVTRFYGDVAAVDRMSLDVEEGAVCVLIGPSGCGKTTTLRMINRLVEPSSGSILINGRDTSTVKPEQLRLSIGYAIQSVGLFPHMTVAQNIGIVPRLLHWDQVRISNRTAELLALVGLNHSGYAAKYPHELSGGEAQRIGVARALAADPPILLMDEPFGAVDPLTRERLQGQFLRIQRTLKKTVILVTHDLDEGVRLADRIAVMESGRLVQYDTPEIILSRPVNRFVRDFVGADRALKRLSRMSITKFIRPAATVRIEASSAGPDGGTDPHRWFWVVDDLGHLMGWADREALRGASSVREVAHLADAAEIALEDDATLREALSRMLGLGFKFVPVINQQDILVGEVALGDVESATREEGS